MLRTGLWNYKYGVYVGNINARVRDELWERICENVSSGRATMVFSCSGEQKMDFRVHNTAWEPVDFDGIKLMRRPAVNMDIENDRDETESKASKAQRLNNINIARNKKMMSDDYVVIDVETTGMSAVGDSLIEVAALRIKNGKAVEEFSKLIKIDDVIPAEICNLTGIDDVLLEREGECEEDVLKGLMNFVGNDKLVGYNISFDNKFLKLAYKKYGIKMWKNVSVDVLPMVRKKISDIKDYKLTTVAEFMGLDTKGAHRALFDCYLAYHVYDRLKDK